MIFTQKFKYKIKYHVKHIKYKIYLNFGRIQISASLLVLKIYLLKSFQKVSSNILKLYMFIF